MLSNCGAGEDSWESLRMPRDQTSQSLMKSTLNIHWKEWCLSWSSNTLATWCEEPTHWKIPWSWERLREEEEEGDRGWDGWMASLTQQTWVWASYGRWWRMGKPGNVCVLCCMEFSPQFKNTVCWPLHPLMCSLHMSFSHDIFGQPWFPCSHHARWVAPTPMSYSHILGRITLYSFLTKLVLRRQILLTHIPPLAERPQVSNLSFSSFVFRVEGREVVPHGVILCRLGNTYTGTSLAIQW